MLMSRPTSHGLVEPVAQIVRLGHTDVRNKLARVIARLSIVADGVLVQRERPTIDLHPAGAVDRVAAHLGSLLPDDLGEMADLVEDLVVGRDLFAPQAVVGHDLELARVPVPLDGGGDVEDAARDGEDVLPVARGVVVGEHVCEAALVGVPFGSLLEIGVPD